FLLSRLRTEQAGGALRHARRAARDGRADRGARPRGGPLQAAARPEGDACRPRRDGRRLPPALDLPRASGTVRRILRRAALGLPGARALFAPPRATQLPPLDPHGDALTEVRARGGRVRGRDDRLGRAAGDGAQAPVGGQPLEPHPAPPLRHPPLLTPARVRSHPRARGGLALSVEPTLHLDVEGSGPVVVLAHGFGGSARNFRPQARALGARYRVGRFDARGHGRSPAPPEADAYTPEAFASDLGRILDRVGAEKAVVGGLSMGAGTALRFALAEPGRVHGLVLAGFPPGARAGGGFASVALRLADAIERA